MNFDFLKNPWVLGGGAAIALVIVLSNRGGGGGSVTDTTNALTSAQIANNQAGLNYLATKATLNANAENHSIDASATVVTQLLNTLSSIAGVNAKVASDMNAQAAGVTQSLIASNTALQEDYNAQSTRLATSYISADVSKAGFISSQNIAQINADNTYRTATSTATIQAGSAALNSLVNAATSIFKGKPV